MTTGLTTEDKAGQQRKTTETVSAECSLAIWYSVYATERDVAREREARYEEAGDRHGVIYQKRIAEEYEGKMLVIARIARDIGMVGIEMEVAE